MTQRYNLFKNYWERLNFSMVLATVFVLLNPFIFINLTEQEILIDEQSNNSYINNKKKYLQNPIIDNQNTRNPTIEKVNSQIDTPLLSQNNGSFQYPVGSSIIPMGIAQNEIQRRILYKDLFNRIYSSSDVEFIMDNFTCNSITYPPGTLTSMSSFGGNFNYTIAREPFNISKGYSLHPRKIAVFKSDVLDKYDQNVTWEEGYFERIFRVYLWGDYFHRINETGICNDYLSNYDILIIPSIKKGYEQAVAKRLGSNGLNNLQKFVNEGNFLYAQGGGCYLAEAAQLVPNGTVLLDKRIDSNNNHADMSMVNASYPMAHGWLSNKMYVIDDPVLNTTDPNAVVAKYSGNITNSSFINTSAIMSFRVNKGDVVLINGHPSVNSDFYPIFFNSMFYSMAETSDLRATCRQIYNPEVSAHIIPAQEANVTVQVEVTYLNFWPDTNNSPKNVTLTETISAYFYLDETNITPTQSNITKRNVTYSGNGTQGNGTQSNETPPGKFETDVSWNFKDTQGIRKFIFHVKTYENSTKKGIVPVAKGVARYTPPGFRGIEEIRHGWIYISAALAARLVGDRDIELDGCYPLRWSGEYFDIALTLENKEGTTAKNITIVDIVCLKSPIVDVVNQSRVPFDVNSNSLCNPIFVKNKVFYYLDKNNKPLYPLPDESYNTTYNYTYWNGTNITLPALKLVWHIEDLVGYDYLEPAIRYGIFSQEEFNRTISFKSDPVNCSIVLNASGGSVFTNLGTHPIPYHKHLEHGVVSIPKGEEIPRVTYKDIWNRDQEMRLRTVFYDIVPFPPPEEHMVVTTTFEMKQGDKRMMEFPIHQDVDLNFKLKTWNGYGKYDPKSYPYHMNITKNETMIVQAIPRGVGYNIDYLEASFNKNTSLLAIHNTSTHTILYFQQDIAGGHKEVIDLNAKLSAYPTVHREGSMKVNDGARFVYHQIAVGPNRYEVFDSHVQAVFAIGNDVNVHKKVAPVYIATFGDDVYHFIRLEDPYEPREFLEDPYIKSHGYGDMAATTYVGGRINETLYHSRVSPGGRTLIRIEVDNNLGYDLNNVSLTPIVPPGFTVTPDNFTTQIPPIFFDFPFINRTDIWDAWKSVYYFWVDIDVNVTGGKVYDINFSFKSNCSNASYLPSDFDIPGAMVGVMDRSGHVEAIFGRAVNVTLSDTVATPIVRPEDVRIANNYEKDALELMLATGVSAPGLYNRSIVNDSYQTLRGINFTKKGAGNINIDLPTYAQMIPWIDNNTNQKTLYVIVRTNVSVNRGGGYVVNKGPSVSYVNHFNETVKIKGNNEYIEAHGPAFYYKMSVLNINCENVLQSCLTGGKNNTVKTRVQCYNWGDDIAQSSTIQIHLPPSVILYKPSLPPNAKSLGNIIYCKLGDIGPGSEKWMEFEIFTTPPEIKYTPNRGPPDPWQLIDFTQVKFVHGYLKKPVAAQPSNSLYGYLFDSDLAMEKISYSHPFAATNNTHNINAYIKNNWQFSDIIKNIKVNFSLDGVYIGTGMIPSLAPGETSNCGVNIKLTKEGIYNIKATIVAPKLNEFFDTNNELERQLIVADPITLSNLPDYGTGTDSFIASLDSKLVFGTEHNLKVGRVSSSGGYGSGIGVTRSFIKFDTTGIPKNALILDANLELYMYKSVGGTLEIYTYQVQSDWAEDSLTWNSKPIYEKSPVDSIAIDTTTGYKTWDITSAVEDWVAQPSANLGLMFKSENENWYWSKEFYSTDTENGLGPKLTVKYSMLTKTPDITKTNIFINDYKEKELRLQWKPVPYALYFEVYKSDSISGPYNKLGSTWDNQNIGENGSLDVFFYDDVDGGYPESPITIYTDRGGQPGTIRVLWSKPSDPAPSASYYYRIKAIGVDDHNSALVDSPTKMGQLTPEIEKYIIYNSTSNLGPWTEMLGETEELTYSQSGLGQGRIMYYRIKSVSTEGYQSTLSKIVVGRSNRAPSVNNLYIDPQVAYTTDYLLAKYTFNDLDGDTDSGSQIRWYRDGVLFPWYKSWIYPSWTTKGQVWYFTVTPKDGIEFGNGASSSVVTIQNSPPRLSNQQFLPKNPTTNDNLTLSYTFYDADKDTESKVIIHWYKNGVRMTMYDGLRSIPSSTTLKNEIWNATICSNDGTDYSIWYKVPAITIKNSKPVASGLGITPSNPKSGDKLTASYSYYDSDNDAEKGSKIQWYKDDQHQSIYDNFLSIPSSVIQKGEVWYFTLEPFDSEDYGEIINSPSVKVENTKPKVTDLIIYPEYPSSSEKLWINYNYFDIDSDPEQGSIITWYCNNEQVVELDNSIIVPSSYTIRDDTWMCSLTPKDGFVFGKMVQSEQVLILNSAPQVLEAIIEPEFPAVKDDLQAKYTTSDADFDSIEHEDINIKWFKDDEEQTELNNKLIIPAKFTGSREAWYHKIQVTDGIEYGPSKVSLKVIINSPPVVNDLQLTPISPSSSDILLADFELFDEDLLEGEIDYNLNWYRNGKLVESLINFNSVQPEMTRKDESWSFKVKPYDGSDYGLEKESEPVIIGNTPPIVSDLKVIISDDKGSGSITLLAQYNYFDIDFDAEDKPIIKWYKNDELVPELIGSTHVPTKLLKRDDIWYFTLIPYDGDDYGKQVRSSAIILENIPPFINQAIVIPESPTTTDDLIAEVEFFDPDNDKDNFYQFDYRWYKNDKLIAEANDWSSIPAKFTSIDDTWYYKLRINDGLDWSGTVISNLVIIENTAPEVSKVKIKPDNPIKTKTIVAEYTFFDIDGDSESDTLIRWFRNDELIEECNDKNEVPVEYLQMGDEWYFTIQPSDGTDIGKLVTSYRIKINTVPTLKDVELKPKNPKENDQIQLSYEYSDFDGDEEDSTEIHWFIDDKHIIKFDGYITLPKGSLKPDEQCYAVITPHDGKEFGVEYKSNEIKIAAIEETQEKMKTDLTAEENFPIVWVILILILILIIAFSLILSRRKQKPEQIQYTEEYQEINDDLYETDTEVEPKTELNEQQEVTTTKAIPIAKFLKTQLKESSESELSTLSYDEIDVEFKCPNCDAEIEAGLESCPECGEDFGKLI